MLYLDEHQVLGADVLDPMRRASRDVDGVTVTAIELPAIEGYHGLTTDDEPMLGSLSAPLVAQPLPGRHYDPLDLVICLDR